MADYSGGDQQGTPEGDPVGKHDDSVDENRTKHSFTFRDADEDSDEKEGGKSRWLREILIIVGIVLVLLFVFTQFFFRQYVVPSESMEPTLTGCYGCTNDRIVVDKMVYRFSDPEPGDVVVFKGPTESWNGSWTSPRSSNPVIHKVQDVLSLFAFAPPDENNLVKRVIATGGQTVQCREADGKGVTVDGKSLNEPYIDKNLQTDNYRISDGVTNAGSCYGEDFGPIKVPDGNVWVMGDNRSNSADSRAHIDDELQGTVPISDIRGKVRTIIYPFSRIGGVGSVNPQD
ncbi:signal peptidase I [Gordonia sp. (in: high G+C Gram-positive bacteria)]|uniref:signal peptidase I n=1 Tax=Gordonia sp. (in: high G+C Gram-positive bacteria) TaxID=84139 RepID=UPI00169CC2D7|nr:signal peptidase I [Gordonia sp. (in: high G+C Gram-positive bacteria)]NLG45630.1 signal peptidase I [Gordonia sp. (in: high G+C Gram-positive bacteria)]